MARLRLAQPAGCSILALFSSARVGSNEPHASGQRAFGPTAGGRWSPAAGLELVLQFDAGGGEALHGAGDLLADFGEDLGVVVVGGGHDDGAVAADRFGALLGIVFYIERRGVALHKNT